MVRNSNARPPIRRVFAVAIIVLCGAALLYWARPLLHFFVYYSLFDPGMFILLVIPTISITILVLYTVLSNSGWDLVVTFVPVIVGGAFVLSAVYSVPAGMVQEETLAQRTMDSAEQVDSLPQVNSRNPRVVPRSVSDKQTRGSVSYRQHRLGTSDIARMEDGTLAWGYPIRPDPFMVYLTGNQRGVYLSDMTRTNNRKRVVADNETFTHGVGMFLHRSANWNVIKSGYWSAYVDDPIAFTHNGEAYMAYPKTGHKWVLSPIPHTVPVWDGVALVDTNGTVTHLTKEEAKQSEVLDGQRLYPLHNARLEAKSLGYRNGIINQLPILGVFKGVVEVADIPNTAGNKQPFVIDTKNQGLSYVMAMEPYGESTRGLDEVWFFDGDTGDIKFYRTGDSQLFGPERAMDVVRSQDSRTGWVATTDGGNFKVVEPVPTIIDGELWWHCKVVTADNTDVSRSVFVNAKTQKSVALENKNSITAFINGKNVSSNKTPQTTTTDSQSQDINYIIVVKNSNGEVVERIPVEEGQDTEIVSGNETTQTTSNSSSTDE